MEDEYNRPTVWGHIWEPSLWLPANLTWSDFRSQEEGYVYTTDKHFFALVVPLAALLGGLQYLVQRYSLRPLGIWMGISKENTANRFPENNIVENAYKSPHTNDSMKIAGLAKKLDWTKNEVRHWLKNRASEKNPTTLEKFCGSCWRCLYFTFSFFFGVATLWNKPWLWDINECWVGFPLKQNLTDDVFWYYLSAMAFTFELFVLHVFENRKKGYWPYFIHHIATLNLLTLSWISGHYRYGSLTILVHDLTDIFLEMTKMTHYAKLEKTNKVAGILFFLSWIAARNVAFPFWIVWSVVKSVALEGRYPVFVVLAAEMLVLLTLHIFWTAYILMAFYKYFPKNNEHRDVEHSEAVGERSNKPDQRTQPSLNLMTTKD